MSKLKCIRKHNKLFLLCLVIIFVNLFHNVKSQNSNDIVNDNKINNNLRNGLTEIHGGIILGERIIKIDESPYIVRTDIEIENGGKLTIEPGVHIHFAPMVGITVRGAIHSVGTPDSKIVLQNQLETGYEEHDLKPPQILGARLVDGPTPLQGRLQLYHRDKWRSVCTNSRNWTIPDYETACRQMGYQGGRFWNWVDRTYSYEPRLVYEEPLCRGTESSLFNCSWSSRQIGSGVCDYHTDIGIQCLPIFEKLSSHWKGISFENAPSERILSRDNTNYVATSLSSLRHTEIRKAGASRNGMVSSAIEVIGVPPILNKVLIENSAYTGINVTLPGTAFKFIDVIVRRSHGIGVFVNSSYGLAHLEGCSVSESGADGIRYVGHDLRSNERTDRGTIYDFCTIPITAGQTYPISLSVQQSPFSAIHKECGKYFITQTGYVITVSFVHFIVNRNDSSVLEIYDGASPNDRLIGSWLIRNSTRPQSLTSTQNKIYIKYRAEPRSDIVGFLRVTTGYNKDYDLNVTNSLVQDNDGRGIAIDNMRSQLHVHNSDVTANGHTAGVHVVNGAGDVNITESRISFNHGDGVNITYFGGNRNVSRSSISSNKGYGFAVWINETAKDREEFVSFNQTTTIEYSTVMRNLETGIRHGNFSGDIWVNITGNFFNDSIQNAVDIQTCWFKTDSNKRLRLQIGHNIFEYTNRIGVVIDPALNLDGRIEYNHFRYGKYGALLIHNKPWEEFRMLPANLLVQHNQFYGNKGVFVASIGLTPYSDRSTQYLLFTRNFVRENKIKEPFGTSEEEGEGFLGERRLNPRSKVAAPIVISSSNVDVFRNIISNKDSKYEVGSQLSDQSKVLNVTYNWLGNTDEERIFNRLFHRKDRYSLAKIEYLPYLLHNSNPGATTIMVNPTFVPHFHVDGSERIGGEVDGQEILESGSYTVERDINIRPGGKLILNSGVTLNFVPNVGMMVAGKLEARGRRPDDIKFTLKREPVMTADNETMELRDMELMDMEKETEPVFDLDETPQIPVRLLGGSSEHEGRLQIYLEEKWGSVCDYGWNLLNAALVCHQLGLTLNPNDWQLHRNEVPSAGSNEEIILSNIRCTEHDNDITKCRAERSTHGEFENSCPSDNVVGIRCYPGGWAGLRFGVLSERTDLQYITVEQAGLFDYSTNTFKPAIQMDFAHHNMENVRVVQNLHDGLGIIYSDIYGGDGINNIKNSEFAENRGNGVSLKQLGLKIQGSVIKDNLRSGINHDSVLSAAEQREIAGWFQMAPDFNSQDIDYHPVILPQDSTEQIEVDMWTHKHILTKRHAGDSIERVLNIRCPPRYVIGIQLLNPIENRSTEEITIFDSQNANAKSDVWLLSRDISIFPMTSSSYGIIIHYKSGNNALGGTVLVFRAIAAPVQDVKNKIIRGPVPTLQIKSTKIQKNTRGLLATYYNRYLGEKGEHYLRKANESIKLINCELSHNLREAFLVYAPFWDVHISNISEITIHINSSVIRDNGIGINQFSKDLRSSNNLFHYVLYDTKIENNNFGGMQISLPYVWQYNENFTHTISIENCTWTRNRRFELSIDGHFAGVNITGNTFTDNECLNGLIRFKGMEKKIKIDQNRISGNNGKYMVEFNSDSQSEILGELNAYFVFNDIRNNKYDAQALLRSNTNYQLQKKYTIYPTSVIIFHGIQKVRISRNLITDNNIDYDLLAGIKSARLNNFLDARENWWGSIDDDHINSRIFDFDDWNNHAEVIFRPYLIEDAIDGSVSTANVERKPLDLNNLGGRIFEDFSIPARDRPYFVKSDLTVMPGVTLTIEPSVQMEFAPNVGLLVLGNLIARGTRDGVILMKNAIPKPKTQMRRVEKSIENMVNQDSIRLCTNRNCSYDDNEIDRKHQGFLEYFNHTTLQWVPICDRRFTERNAQVVCRELGFNPLDVFYGHDRRIEFHTNSLTRIWSWVEPLECYGDEERMELCPERLNGQLYGRRHNCRWDSSFVFVSCNGYAEQQPFWGGMRFANSDFEQNLYEHRIHDVKTHQTIRRKESVIENLRIENAGILHGEKSPSIQTIFRTPQISLVTIVDSAHHAVNLISPQDAIHLQFLKINNALGQGINAISLTGEGRESEESSFAPLKTLDLPYHLFSVIDICDTSKEIILEERVIVYYKYDNSPVNCVKIFTSAYRVKPLGFRLLQSNLFNHSKEYGRRDVIQLFDGDIYNVTAKPVGNIEADSDNQKHLFRTHGPTLSVRLIASGAPSGHGFFAEVVTIPISAIGSNRDAQHNISNTEITNAVGGAIAYYTAGEVSPILTLDRNRIINNCRQLYGNFSTCDAAVKIDVQNMQSFYFRNNLVYSNQGGLYIRADSRGSATSLRGWIHHNLFTKNLNRPSVWIEGRQSSPYQEVTLFKNYFSQNNAAYDDVIALRQVVSNFTYNYVHSNRGGRIVEISGFNKVRLPIYQTTSHNGFYDNVATDWRGRATIVAGTAGQHYVDNIFYNPDNDYEMITVNRSNTLDVWKTKIDATFNYWNWNESLAVGGRIRDRSDDPILLEVQYTPYHMNNATVLDGKCPPGWTLMLDTCYIYVGAPMTFQEARDFCRSDNASMPFIKRDTTALWDYLQRQMEHFRWSERVWIQDLNSLDECTTFVYRTVEIDSCDARSAFLCEIDPKVVIDPLSWKADIVAISVIIVLACGILLLCCIGCLWYNKSKHRHAQRLQRRNSIRQSLRSLNSIDPQGSIRRRNYNMTRSTDTLTKSTATDYKKMISNGSIESMDMDKSVLSSETSYDMYDPQNQQINEYANPKTKYQSDILNEKYNEFALQKPIPKENGNKTAKVYGIPDFKTPGFELAYRNEGFRDNSTYGGGTRTNSENTVLNDDSPIIHQTDIDDNGSDYYGNSSTLPLRSKGDLSFLAELKTRLPEYEPLSKPSLGHSSFLPSPPPAPSSNTSNGSSTYEKKIDKINFTPEDHKYHVPEIRKPPNTYNNIKISPPEVKRPDSYYTAVRSSKAPQHMLPIPPPTPKTTPQLNRPKTVYESSGDDRPAYSRSKSEALLETNFDDVDILQSQPLKEENRSYSQPLETAM